MQTLSLKCSTSSAIPEGTFIHNIELYPGKGDIVRSAGTSAQILGEGKYVTVRLASGEVRKILATCRATIGIVEMKTTV